MEYPDYRTEYIQSPKPISTRKLAKKWRVAYTRIVKQCKRDRWVEERREFQAKVKAKQEEEAVETLAEARTRWAKEYRTLQAVGLKGLSKLQPRTAGESARILDLGIKGEKVHREEQDDDETTQAIKEIVVKWGDKPHET
jgi:L-lactate utilization protein LutC